MNRSSRLARTALCATLVLVPVATPSAHAETLRWSRAGDSITLDPHAQNEGPTHALSHQIYEPLLHRDMAGKIVPALATGWKVLPDQPTVWRFALRRNVSFHGGEAFDADDVIFSFNRARQPTSAMRELLASVTALRKIDSHTVDIVTDGPNPLLPNNLTNLFVMDAGWTRANKASEPQNVAKGDWNHAATHANGTGAYRLKGRRSGKVTELTANPSYWGIGQFPLMVKRIIYRAIKEPNARTAALLTGLTDFVQDLPVDALDRVRETTGLKVESAPQNRTMMLGLNVGSTDISADNIDHRNPLASPLVREAMSLAIDRSEIQRDVMRGQSRPAGIIVSPFVNGWSADLDRWEPPNLTRARELMREAGFDTPFFLRLDCPNDRYINDAAVCAAVADMLGQIGIRVSVDAQPKTRHFPSIRNLTTDFYLLGWGATTFDSEYIFDFLVHSRTGGYGSWNATRFADPEIDRQIEALSTTADPTARNAAIARLWQRIKTERIYIPLHHQVLNWGMTDRIDFPVQPEDQPHFKYMKFRTSPPRR